MKLEWSNQKSVYAYMIMEKCLSIILDENNPYQTNYTIISISYEYDKEWNNIENVWNIDFNKRIARIFCPSILKNPLVYQEDEFRKINDLILKSVKSFKDEIATKLSIAEKDIPEYFMH